MDRIINVKVDGNYLSKDNKNAGVQHEANVTALRIEFDDGWDGYAKKVTFWDAKGENPVERTLTADLLEDITKSTRIYLCLIPGEALEEAGWCTFVIDGYVSGKRQRSISDKLMVKDAPFQETSGEPEDPTPTQAEQLQVQIDTLLEDMAAEATTAVNAKTEAQAAKEAAETAQGKAETAQAAAETAKVKAETAQSKAETSQSKAETAMKAAEDAKSVAESAQSDAEASKTAAEAAQDAAEISASAANTSATEAKRSATDAEGSSADAASYAASAKNSATDALESANAAKASETSAKTSETNAKSSETAAKASENAAAESATKAAEIAGGDFATRKELAAVKTFIAEYGITTNAEIQAAVDAEKAVFCRFNSSVFAPLAMSDGATSHTFMVASQDGCLQIVCNDNEWSNENKKHTGVFYATYDTTTYDEIAAAISAGKDVLLCTEYESIGIGKSFSVLIDSDMGKETEPWVEFCQAFPTKIYIQRCTKQTDGTTLWVEHSKLYMPREHASQHASDGIDPITPESIGAAPVSDSGTVQSGNADYAEIGEWADGNTGDEDRIGYFVAVDPDTAGTTMVKATSTMDVRGVTVSAPAFSGNCSSDKFDSNGNLLKQYDYVAVIGLVSVIDNGTCTVNGRCMPNDSGTAVPSSNNMGYQVIDRIDSTHILIAVEPGADMLNRIKTVVTELQNGKAPSTHASQHASDGSDPITPASIGAAASSHNHSASNITSGTLAVARGGTGQTTLTPAVGTKGVRQIYAGTDDMTAGTTSLTTGVLYFVYE